MMVSDSSTHDVILGMNWLENAQAEIQVSESRMIIKSHGQEFEVPLNYTTSPKQIIYSSDEDLSDEESAEQVFTVMRQARPADRTKKWQKFATKEAWRWEHEKSSEATESSPDPSSDKDEIHPSRKESCLRPPLSQQQQSLAYRQIEEKILIEDAKARYYGMNWREEDECHASDASFWLANITTLSELSKRRLLGPAYTEKGAPEHERQEFCENAFKYEVEALRQEARRQGKKDQQIGRASCR